jgi:hypothetical protein
VPVSRKRKKKPGKTARPRNSAGVHQRGSVAELTEQDRREVAAALQGLTSQRDEVRAGRRVKADALAGELVADLVTTVANQPAVIVEDELCLRLGTRLSQADQAELADRAGPGQLAAALVPAAAAAVEAAVGETDTWRAPWRVLTAVAGILPYPESEAAAEAITRLRDGVGRRVLPSAPPGPTVTGPVRWTRDRYGSRFAVVAPITTADQPPRWYLWDIDACGHEAFTVHSGYYATPEAALSAWQAGVGPTASEGTELAPVDDPWLVAELLPAEAGVLRTGGENEEQFAEYHRSKRLGQAVRQALPPPGRQPDRGPDKTTAAAEFAAWLRDRNPGQPQDLDELTEELADSWGINDIDAVFTTCSPHRVASFMDHVPGYYVDEIADRLIALLPDWITWLAERNATPPELADRSLRYAQGERDQHVTSEEDKPHYLTRVAE